MAGPHAVFFPGRGPGWGAGGSLSEVEVGDIMNGAMNFYSSSGNGDVGRRSSGQQEHGERTESPEGMEAEAEAAPGRMEVRRKGKLGV
jgi:hypothetical protein